MRGAPNLPIIQPVLFLRTETGQVSPAVAQAVVAEEAASDIGVDDAAVAIAVFEVSVDRWHRETKRCSRPQIVGGTRRCLPDARYLIKLFRLALLSLCGHRSYSDGRSQ